jgi:hypothetical protein
MQDQATTELTMVATGQTVVPNIRALDKERLLSKTYDVEGTRVLLTCQEFFPKNNEPLSNKAIIFFPGWPLRADSHSIHELCSELAIYAQATTYSIHTRNEQVMPNTLYIEAEAVC